MRTSGTWRRFAAAIIMIGLGSPLATISVAYAQATKDPGEDFPAPAIAATPPGTISCFDYYRFGSVQANISAQTSSAVSGTAITFTGTLTNENPFPVTDGALYVKVFRLREDAAEKNVNGPYVVDQFFVRDGINLPAHGTMPLVFSWDIPSYAQSGQYEVATFFTTSKKYNLLGLAFTDDVVGNRAGFSVVGEVQGVVEFDKDAVKISGEPYRFAAFAPRESATGNVPIEAVIRNASASDALVSVSWQAYAWDAGRYENLIDRSEQSIAVEAGGEVVATYTVTDVRYPVYLVVGTLNWQNTQSIINVRFVRGDKDRLRINFPGVTDFPITAGEEVTLFSCLHNAGESALVPDGRLELKLSDSHGRTIHEYVYEGDVTGTMMGVAESFMAKRTYDSFTLDAFLYQQGKLVDDAHLVYDCRSIDPRLCLRDDPAEILLDLRDWPLKLLGIAALLLAVASGMLWLLVVIVRVRRSARDNGIT